MTTTKTRPAPRHLSTLPATTGRRLHLIDIENEVCGDLTPATCRDFYTAYTRLGILGPLDHVIVGVSPRTLSNTFALPVGWRRVMGPRGPQSADLALLAAEPAPDQLATYTELVLASADGGFLDLALRAKNAGLKLTIVTNRRRRPQRLLYAAAHQHLTVTVGLNPVTLLVAPRRVCRPPIPA